MDRVLLLGEPAKPVVQGVGRREEQPTVGSQHDEAVLAPKGFGMPVYLALTYAGLGEKDKALPIFAIRVHNQGGIPWDILLNVRQRHGDRTLMAKVPA